LTCSCVFLQLNLERQQRQKAGPSFFSSASCKSLVYIFALALGEVK